MKKLIVEYKGNIFKVYSSKENTTIIDSYKIKKYKDMKNETKLKKLMSFLDENGIKYTTPRKRKEGSAHLFIGQYMIAVKIEGEDDTLFFDKHKRGKHPFFIRTSETPKYIIEKMQNLITRMMLIQQKHFMEQKK